jgi:hypothetical protein
MRRWRCTGGEEIVLHIKSDSLLYALCVMAILYMASAHTYAGQASLQWDYTASGAAGFVLYCGTSSGNYTTRIDVGNTTSYTISNLTNGATYFCAVTAYDSAKHESLYSSQIQFTVPNSTPTAPLAPNGVTVSNGTSASSVTVNWTASSGATSYSVLRSTTLGSNGSSVAVTSSVSFIDTSITPGVLYFYSVVASNSAGNSPPSAQVSGYGGTLPSGSGALGGSGVATFTAANLSNSGTSDWAKWPNYIHKATGGAQISNFIKIGAASVQNYNNDRRPLSWSDGTPTTIATNDTAGVFIAGVGNGFQVTAPADTSTRTLLIYAGGWASGGKLAAHLSDGSAPDFVDASFSSTTGQYDAVYTLTYRAGSAGKQLVVQWTQASGTGNVTLQAAALAGAPPSSGALLGSGVAGSAGTSLTSGGTSDWAKWPNYIHKATGGAQISNFTKLGASSVQNYTNDPRPVSWTDGTPTTTGTNDTTGVYIAGIGNGLQISVPADTKTRTLLIYVGGWLSGGKFMAHLSDGSAADFVNTSFSSTTGQYDAVYTLTYHAATSGQQLVVQWTQASGTGNVTLQAAALQ